MAVILSSDEYESLVETMNILSGPSRSSVSGPSGLLIGPRPGTGVTLLAPTGRPPTTRLRATLES